MTHYPEMDSVLSAFRQSLEGGNYFMLISKLQASYSKQTVDDAEELFNRDVFLSKAPTASAARGCPCGPVSCLKEPAPAALEAVFSAALGPWCTVSPWADSSSTSTTTQPAFPVPQCPSGLSSPGTSLGAVLSP